MKVFHQLMYMFAALWVFTCMFTKEIMAQCGSFGDPIINITFGNAANPMTRLPEGETDYILHNGIGFMGPEYYMITDNAFNGAPDDPGAYHNLRDHTGDPGGGMLLVNASWDPGIFYTSIQPGLCTHTDFNFSAWVVNVSPPEMSTCEGISLPIHLQFEILNPDGDILAVLPIGPIAGSDNPEWVQYDVSFSTGDYAEVQLIIRNLGEGGCGNNLAIDDIQFRPCGPGIDLDASLEIWEIEEDNTVFLCIEENNVTFESNLDGGYNTPIYQWQLREGGYGVDWIDIPDETQSTLTVVQPDDNTWYRLTVASSAENLRNESCRVVSDPIRVLHGQTPVVNYPLVNDILTCINQSVELQPADFEMADIGPLTYQWHVWSGNDWEQIPGGDGAHHTPLADVSGAFHYQRRAVNVCGVDFPINEYIIQVMPIEQASLIFEIPALCIDNEGMVLEGGMPAIFSNGLAGIYSGPGVIDGVFYPHLAGIGNHTIIYSPPGVMCGNPAISTIEVMPLVSMDNMIDAKILPGQHIRLNPVSNATSFAWDPDPSLDRYDVRDPLANPTITTTYRVVATNDAGCEKEGFVTVAVLSDLIIPNSFTPNGDGINDVWEIEGLEDYPNVFIQVFNRWGSLVFSSKGYDTAWNGQFSGTPLPSATYYYTISSDVFEQPLNGAVTILR